MKSNKQIVMTLQVEGLHAWKGVTKTPYADQVGFLQFPHRHIFHIKCTKEVSHGDRDLEIIDLKRKINNYLLDKYAKTQRLTCDFGQQSCEMIADELVKKFTLESCEVLEDGENGAIVFPELKVGVDFAGGKDFEAAQHFVEGPMSVQAQMSHKKVFGLNSSDYQGEGIVFVCGYLQSGKSTITSGVALSLKHLGHLRTIEVSDIVSEIVNSSNREDLQGKPELDELIITRIRAEALSSAQVIVSGARQVSILKAFPKATLLWIDTPQSIRFNRFQNSPKDGDRSEVGFLKANVGDLELGIQDVKHYIFNRQHLKHSK